jgi:hypothetical protein
MNDHQENVNVQQEECVFNINSKYQSPYVQVEIDRIKCKLLIDSGASVNCLDRATFEKVKKNSTSLHKCHTKIYPYAQKIPLKVLGIAEMKMKLNETETKIKFHIIDKECTPLLGQQTAVDLGLLKFCINNVKTNQNNMDNILSEFSDRFQGLGKLKDFQLQLYINKDVKPIAQPNRRIPFKMRQQVREKI